MWKVLEEGPAGWQLGVCRQEGEELPRVAGAVAKAEYQGQPWKRFVQCGLRFGLCVHCHSVLTV